VADVVACLSFSSRLVYCHACHISSINVVLSLKIPCFSTFVSNSCLNSTFRDISTDCRPSSFVLFSRPSSKFFSMSRLNAARQHDLSSAHHPRSSCSYFGQASVRIGSRYIWLSSRNVTKHKCSIAVSNRNNILLQLLPPMTVNCATDCTQY